METDLRRDGAVRISILAVILAALFLAIAGKAAWNALGQSERRPGVVATASERVERADIIDRNGELLASSITVYTLFADPRAVWDADSVARALASVFPDLDIELTAWRLSDKSRGEVYLRRGLTPRERQQVFNLGLEGIGFKEDRARIYPMRTLAGHVLGHVNLAGDGLAGIEFALDERLSAGGDPVRLTLDSAVQASVELELSAAASDYNIKGGAGIVLDARTGEILALASWPPIDPNRYTEYDQDAPERINRAVAAVYELGSVFKPLTIAAAFETGELLPGETFDLASPMTVGGRPVNDTHPGPARATVTEILVESSNRGTVQIAMRVGPRRLQDFFAALGLMERAPIELASSEAPIRPADWRDLTFSRVSYGHAFSVSPLAFAVAFSAFGNSGEIVAPRLVMNGDRALPKPRRVMSAPTAALVTAMMRENVIRGSGQRAEVGGFRVAGKTGTAEKPIPGGYDRESNISSFAALFPADDPKFVVLVVLDDPEAGEQPGETAAWNAAPTTGRIIERIAPMLGVKPVLDPVEVDPIAAERDRRRRETTL